MGKGYREVMAHRQRRCLSALSWHQIPRSDTGQNLELTPLLTSFLGRKTKCLPQPLGLAASPLTLPPGCPKREAYERKRNEKDPS